MSTPITLKPSEIDVSLIKLIETKNKNSKNPSPVKTYSLKYKHSKGWGDLEIYTPKMVAPFGIGNNLDMLKKSNPNFVITEDTANQVKWSIQLSFQGEDNDTDEGKKIKAFKDKLFEIDNRLKELYLEQWADQNDPMDDGSKHDSRTIKYKSCVKKSKSKTGIEYPDYIRVDIQWDKTKNLPRDGVEFFSSKGSLSEYTEVNPRSKIRGIIKYNSLSYSAMGVNPKTRLVQLKFYEPEAYRPPKGLRIQADSDEEEEEEESEESVEEEIESEEEVESDE